MILRKLGELLHHCSRTNDFSNSLSLHALIIKTGLIHDLIIRNHLVNMYAKHNNFESAHKVFDSMHERNLVSWSVLIAAYNQVGNHTMALDLFTQMNLNPNEYVYASVLSSCASLRATPQGKQVHAHALKAGYNFVSFVSNSLMSMYMKCGCFDDALSIFKSSPEPDSIAYNTMMMGFTENSQSRKGLELFRIMNRQGFERDHFSYMSVLKICIESKDFATGVGLHCQTIKLGLDVTTFVGNVILTMYSQSSSIVEVNKAFDSVEEKDAVTCNAYIVACNQCGEHAKGLRLYREMEGLFGVGPDDFTITSTLAACAELASIRHGAHIHGRLIRTRSSFDVGVSNAIINMYAKCGSIGYANKLFHCLPNKTVVSWNTMIVALGNHGLGRLAIETFNQMKDDGTLPDSVTFIGLLAACSHAGLVDEGLSYFDSMREISGVSPDVEHFSCLIDLLGRAGKLKEAEARLRISPFVNDLVLWGSLLSSCRLHGDVLVGERAARRLMELEPSSSSPYVLLSNLYASDGRWGDVAEARKLLKGSGLKKEPGHSLVDVEDVVVKFTVGDFSHERKAEIVETIRSLNLIAEEVYFMPKACSMA